MPAITSGCLHLAVVIHITCFMSRNVRDLLGLFGRLFARRRFFTCSIPCGTSPTPDLTLDYICEQRLIGFRWSFWTVTVPVCCSFLLGLACCGLALLFLFFSCCFLWRLYSEFHASWRFFFSVYFGLICSVICIFVRVWVCSRFVWPSVLGVFGFFDRFSLCHMIVLATRTF